jgi:predicted metal-binding membrane protein
MMAAMMFPSVSPTVALYARLKRGRDPVAPVLFASGYLAIWSAAGVAAYGVFRAGRAVLGDQLAWDSGGRWLAGAVLVVAAAYELTPAKNLCLSKCRSPLGFLMGSWRDGRSGALSMGARHGAWCLGCCWALMAALFALGVMSIAWTAVVAGVIALEKTLPYRRVAVWGVTAFLLVLAIGVVAFPQDLPGLTVPGGSDAMNAMDSMQMH